MRPFMTTSGYKDHAVTKQRKTNQAVLKDATVRNFSGGWNVVDSELNLSSDYQVVSDNVVREEDGSLGIRYGTALHFNFTEDADIVNMFYFLDQLVVVHSDGLVTAVRGDGQKYNVTDTWQLEGLVVTFCCFAVFKNELIITNGVNKPLLIKAVDVTAVPIVLEGNYLINPVEVSNANVPIARYVTVKEQYVIFGNSTLSGSDFGPNWLHISAKGAPGVYAADYDPADSATFYASTAVDVDIGEWGVHGDHIVNGLNTYREKLVVGCPNSVLLGTLGQLQVDDVSNDVHVPDFADVLDGVGVHSHRSMVNTGTDLLFVDHIGVVSLQKSLYSGDVEPKRVSELIDPNMNANVARLSQVTMEDLSFAVYNSREKRYMLFLPNRDPLAPAELLPIDPFFVDDVDDDVMHIQWPGHTMEVGEFVRIDNMTAWNVVDPADYNGISHQVIRVIDEDNLSIAAVAPLTLTHPDKNGGGDTATATPQFTETFGYVYTDIRGLKVKSWTRFRGWIWQCGTESELSNVFFARTQKVWLYGNNANPLHSDFIGDADETAIDWVAELPWADFDVRLKEKVSRHIALDTTGTSLFTVMMFVDNLYKRIGELIPNNAMTFKGGGSSGYGDGNQPFGGGIHTADERLTAWTARFKLAKLRLQGSSTEPLRVISVSLTHQRGDYRR